MKKFLVILLMLTGMVVTAKEQQMLVLPLYTTGGQNYNSYGYETTSEIIAGDIMQKILLGTQINPVKLAGNDADLKLAGEIFRKTGVIDFEKLSLITAKKTSDTTLLVASYVSDKSGKNTELWDLLKLSDDFRLNQQIILTTKVILFDSKDGIALWQKTYPLSLTVGNVNVNEQYEKVRSYSKNIISKDVEEALNLRFSGKSINFAPLVKPSSASQEGIGLKYYKKGGIPNSKITKPEESFDEQLLKDDSFSL